MIVQILLEPYHCLAVVTRQGLCRQAQEEKDQAGQGAVGLGHLDQGCSLQRFGILRKKKKKKKELSLCVSFFASVSEPFNLVDFVPDYSTAEWNNICSFSEGTAIGLSSGLVISFSMGFSPHLACLFGIYCFWFAAVT